MWEFIAKYWLEVLFGLIVAGLGWAYRNLAKRFKAEREKNQAIENGVRDILRIQILDSYDKCVANGRKITVSRKDAIDSAYRSYHALGGNGTVSQAHDEIMKMDLI